MFGFCLNESPAELRQTARDAKIGQPYMVDLSGNYKARCFKADYRQCALQLSSSQSPIGQPHHQLALPMSELGQEETLQALLGAGNKETWPIQNSQSSPDSQTHLIVAGDWHETCVSAGR